MKEDFTVFRLFKVIADHADSGELTKEDASILLILFNGLLWRDETHKLIIECAEKVEAIIPKF